MCVIDQGFLSWKTGQRIRAFGSSLQCVKVCTCHRVKVVCAATAMIIGLAPSRWHARSRRGTCWRRQLWHRLRCCCRCGLLLSGLCL